MARARPAPKHTHILGHEGCQERQGIIVVAMCVRYCTTVIASCLCRQHYTEAAEDEIKLLRALRNGSDEHMGKRRVVMLHDSFKHKGPHGVHVCMVMEVLGCPLLSVIKQYRYSTSTRVPSHASPPLVCLGVCVLMLVC
jgi:hypothetical protein